MKYESLTKAIVMAAAAHAGQVDKCGAPYILHPLRVMIAVAHHGEAAMTVAVLHDVIEDTLLQETDIEDTFSPEVADAVFALTRADAHLLREPYFDYIERVRVNRLAQIVKFADIHDNMRAPFPFPPSMRDRYLKALRVLGYHG